MARNPHTAPATVAGGEVQQDIGDDLFEAVLRAEHGLHRAPTLFELGAGDVVPRAATDARGLRFHHVQHEGGGDGAELGRGDAHEQERSAPEGS